MSGRTMTAMQALQNSKQDLSGKTAVVTGGNQGLGAETVRVLASANCRVLLCCRNTQMGETAAAEIMSHPDVKGKGTVVVKPLDLANLASVEAFVKDFLETEQRLDFLVLNAGVMKTPQMKTKQGFELQIGTNHHGHFHLTMGLLEKMKAQGHASRIVTVSSSLNKDGNLKKQVNDLHFAKTKYNKDLSYGNSKLANILFTKELSKQLKGTAVEAFALEPGVIPTQLSRHLGCIGVIFRKTSLGKVLFPDQFKTVEQGAATQVYACVAPELQGKSGAYLKDCALFEPTNPEAKDEALAAQLWEVTAKEVEAAK